MRGSKRVFLLTGSLLLVSLSVRANEGHVATLSAQPSTHHAASSPHIDSSHTPVNTPHVQEQAHHSFPSNETAFAGLLNHPSTVYETTYAAAPELPAAETGRAGNHARTTTYTPFSHKALPAELAGMHHSTTFDIAGQDTVEHHGIVSGLIVRSSSWIGRILAIPASIFGGKVGSFTKLGAQARYDAFIKMLEQAKKQGANAVIGIHFVTSDFGRGNTEVVAYGTAVTVRPKAASSSEQGSTVP